MLFAALICIAFMLTLLATGQWANLNRNIISGQNQSSYRIPYEAPTKTSLVFSWIYSVAQPIAKVAIWALPVVLIYGVVTTADKFVRRIISWVQFNFGWSNIQSKLLSTVIAWTVAILLIWSLMTPRIVLPYLLAALAGFIFNLVFYSLAHVIRPNTPAKDKS